MKRRRDGENGAACVLHESWRRIGMVKSPSAMRDAVEDVAASADVYMLYRRGRVKQAGMKSQHVPRAKCRDFIPAYKKTATLADGRLLTLKNATYFFANKCSTPARSSRSSLSVASMRAREKSFTSRPCTISYLPFFTVTG